MYQECQVEMMDKKTWLRNDNDEGEKSRSAASPASQLIKLLEAPSCNLR